MVEVRGLRGVFRAAQIQEPGDGQIEAEGQAVRAEPVRQQKPTSVKAHPPRSPWGSACRDMSVGAFRKYWR